MTYQEIKDRLSKCELTLEKLKNGKSTSKDVKLKTEKLTLLRESYIKLLKEADKGVIYTDDEKKAKDLADDGSNVKLTKEQEGIKFSVDETKAIAKKVGKAVAMSLRNLGDAVNSMKAKQIEENSFEIEVNYKGQGPNDQFSFYITDDTLHLVDFSFDKEISDVGVKPSGEALVNVDVVANELTKHFRSMNEKVDEKDKPELKKLSKALSNSVKAHQDQKKALDKAINTEGEVSEAPDNMYYIKVPKTDKGQQNAVQNVIETFYSPVRFADIVDDDGAGNVIMYIRKEDFQEGMIDDLEGEGINVESQTNFPTVNEDAEEDAKNDADYAQGWHDDPRQDEDTDVGHQDDEPNMLGASAMETAEYAAKLVKKLQRYDQHDGEVDFPNWWQKKLILAREYISAAYHYLDSEEKQPAIDQLALESKVNEGRGDMDIITNLISDKAAESGFSEKEEAMEVMEAIGEHYGINFEYGRVGDNLEENLTYKEPKGIDKVAGGIPYTREGNKFIISMELPDDVKERLLDKAKKNGFEAAPNQAGGVTIMAKDRINEVDEDRYVRAAFEDLEQVIRNLAHTTNISEDEALEMAIRKLEAMLDGRDDLDEGRKDDDALYPDNTRLPEIKNLADKIVSMVKAEAAKGELGYIKTMEEIRYQQEDDFERTPEWNKAKGIKSDFDDYGSGTNEGDDDLDEKKNIVFSDSAYDMVVHTMKRLAKKYKAGDKSVVKHLKKLTHIKKQLEKAKIAKAAKIGQDQELETDTELREAGPGFKHDCAAKVIHKEHGAGNTIPEKHTLVKEGNKYVVTHYDVLFENGNTVLDIPVNELDIKTTNEHWHKGYKKKKK